MVDILAEDTPNPPSPEQPTTYQEAVAEMSNRSALLVLKFHKQEAQGKVWEKMLHRKLHLIYLEMSFLPNLTKRT
jgi:hypothetical protein